MPTRTETKYMRLDADVIEAVNVIAEATRLRPPQIVNAILADRLWLDEGNPDAPRRLLANMIVATGQAVLHSHP